jgi:hypothetical protein
MKRYALFIVVALFIGLNTAIGQWSYNGSNIYNTNSGNVGIGNNIPGTLLTVGNIMTEPAITVRNFGGSGGATYSMIDDASGANWKFKATSTGGFKIRDHTNLMDVITIEANSAANSLFIRAGGSVGIGTSTPLATDKLTVTTTSGNAILATNSGPSGVGIYGYASSGTGLTYGVRGYCVSPGGYGGYFHSDNSISTGTGVYGRADGDNAAASCGVAGQHYWNGVGVGAWSYTGDLIRASSGDYPGGTIRFYITNAGVVYADGGFNSFKKVVMPGGKEEYRTFNTIQTTESWIEDFGSANLNKGSAIVAIDPIYAQAVDLQGGYKVFITPLSEEIVLLTVTEKSADHFTVKGVTIDGRPASCSFDYRIVAIDAAGRGGRMEVVNIPDPVVVPRTE